MSYSPREDISGNIYNNLTAIEFAYVKKNKTYWKFKCLCGNTTIKSKPCVKRGNTKTCGSCFKGQEISQDIVKYFFDYNKETGEFKRKIHGGEPIKSLTHYGYLTTTVLGKAYLVHGLIHMWVEGYFPENDIDHIDQDRTNNKWKNFRVVSRACNVINSNNMSRNNSGVKGVSYNKTSKTWVAFIKLTGKNFNVGSSEDFTEAVAHRFAAEQCLGFTYCNQMSTANTHMNKYLGRG